MNKKAGFALVGAGSIAKIHAKVINELNNAWLVGVYDILKSSATDLAHTYDVRCYNTYNELLRDAQVDIISVCTPSGLREDFVIKGANARKHMICEKPLEIETSRIDRMIDACYENGVSLTGIFNLRYSCVYKRVKDAVDGNEFGKLLHGAIYIKWYRDDLYYENSDWRGTWKYDGGGALMNQSVHFVDLLQWIMGPVAEVKAYTATQSHRIEVEDMAVAVVRFENGALGVIEGTTSAKPGLYDRLEILGVKGSVLIENGCIKYWNLSGKYLDNNELNSLNQHALQSQKNAAMVNSEFHRLQLEEAVTCILNGCEPPLNGKEARKAVDIILRIYREAGIR